MTKAEKINAPARSACKVITVSRGFEAIRSRTYSASKTIPGGIAGRTYPGSFDCEIEKKTTITAIQTSRNAFRLSASRVLNLRTVQTHAVATNTDHGTHPNNVTGM